MTGRKVASLLLSSSFGANAILYAAFLGYVMGMWALIIQFAWVLSFYLLARYASKVYVAQSLHDFLGGYFGKKTRKLAALCSIIGITYFAGWEVAVANSSIQSLGALVPNLLSGHWAHAPIIFLGLALAGTIVYTTLWGMKASGVVDLFLNSVKIICLVLVMGILWYSLSVHEGVAMNLLFPPPKEAVLSLGIIGFVTNIIFNLSWQFVDNSSWQSISSSEASPAKVKERMIKWAGLGTLLTVNGVGTLLGALMRGNSAVDSSNILGQVVSMSTNFQALSLIAMVVLIVLSVMSLFDGAILSVSQSLVVDLGLKINGKKADLKYARVMTLVVGIFAAWGVERIINSLGGSIFNFVYIVILAQVSLIGPVLVGLIKPEKIHSMWVAIAISLFAGVGATIIGTLSNNQNLLQAAGTIATLTSVMVAAVLYWRTKTAS